jgi:phage shock protein PspC (stress-responsive transcriptional regulator)
MSGGRELELMRSSGDSKRKRCPWCAEEIRAEAIKCRYCGSIVEPERGGLASLSRPWTRPRHDRKIAGVCAGLADQFGVSVTILRLAFLLGVIFSGGMFLLVYVVLWIAMPEEPEERYADALVRDDDDPFE